MKRKLSMLLACCLLLGAFPGCSSGSDSSVPGADSAVSDTENKAETDASQNGYTPNGTEKLHITIDSAEVTLDELKAQDYQVMLFVTLDKNPGITSSQWGLQIDKRCTVKASSSKMIINTVFAINDETRFLWTAWVDPNGMEMTDEGSILQVGVTLPMDAAPGDTYTVTYAEASASDTSHQWKSLEHNWVAEDAVGWTDGVITVVE